MFHRDGPTLFELMVQAMSSTQRGYDLLAPKFDYTPFRTPTPLIRAVVPYVGEVDRLLDVCCGTGAAMEVLRECCGREIVGLDSSPGMLAIAEQRSQNWKGCAAVRFECADARAMTHDETFDAAVCFGAFGHILPEEQSAFLNAIRDALRPGGVFVFVTLNPLGPASTGWWLSRGFNAAMRVRNAIWTPPFTMYYLLFTLDVARTRLAQAGFEVEEFAGVIPAPWSRYVVVRAIRQ